MGFIQLKNISKEFKGPTRKSGTQALDNINIEINEGDIVCFLGPSGSGKTTLLRIIAGIESETQGSIYVNEIPVNKLNAQQRNFGFVFQNIDAIFPHLTVFDNIAFPLNLKLRKSHKVNTNDDVKHILKQVNLSSKSKSYPHELSGGEKQRVALARALVYKPTLLLLDEPLSSLDNILKRDILNLIKQLHEKFRMTILYVTHDEREAFEIADRVVILSHGKILQEGLISEIINKPRNSQVARIIGDWNIISGKFRINENEYFLMINGIDYKWDKKEFSYEKEIELGIPISKINFTTKRIEDQRYLTLEALIKKLMRHQSKYIIEVSIGSQRLKFETDAELSDHIQVNNSIYLQIEKSNIEIWK